MCDESVHTEEDGAWAMLVIPFILGMFAGGADVKHIPLFCGWLFLYLAASPAMMMVKKKNIVYYQKWVLIYGIPAVVFLLISVLLEPLTCVSRSAAVSALSHQSLLCEKKQRQGAFK